MKEWRCCQKKNKLFGGCIVHIVEQRAIDWNLNEKEQIHVLQRASISFCLYSEYTVLCILQYSTVMNTVQYTIHMNVRCETMPPNVHQYTDSRFVALMMLLLSLLFFSSSLFSILCLLLLERTNDRPTEQIVFR